LVVCKKVSDIAGLWNYLFKEYPVRFHGFIREPPGVHVNALSESARSHHAKLRERADGGDQLLPPEGKLRTLAPREVPDFLVKAAVSFGLDLRDMRSFSITVHRCVRAGVRFDASKLGSYKLLVDMIVFDPDDPRAQIVQHEIEWKAAK
jgi:hypothetical protein